MNKVFEKSLENTHLGYKEEAKAFGELGLTKESKALVGLFFGHTECKKQKLYPEKPVKFVLLLKK